MRVKRTSISLLFCFVVTAILALSACDVLPQPQVAGVIGTVTPTATMDPSGYQAISPESCTIGNWSTIQAERRQAGYTFWSQGDMVSFQPYRPGEPARIAYMAPSDRSSWLAGELRLAEGPDFKEHITLARNVLAVGDLTWSPSGDRLAFIAFRPEDSLYTVMIAGADGSGLVDLFPADLARTDNRSAQKAIVAWEDEQKVQVVSSCGEQCLQGFEVDISQPTIPALIPTPIADYKELYRRLSINRHELPTPTGEPLQFPKVMNSPHWSPDEKSLVYLDRRAMLWYLSIDRKINYLLDIGLRDVHETRWSPQSDYLAVRAEDRIFLMEIPCKTPDAAQ